MKDKWFLPVLLFAFSLKAVSEDKINEISAAPTAILVSEMADENSALTMRCSGKQPFQTLKCNFEKIRVRKADGVEIEKSKKFAEELLNSKVELKKAIAEFRTKLCSEKSTVVWNDLFQQNAKFSNTKMNLIKANKTNVDSFCACVDKPKPSFFANQKECLSEFLNSGATYEQKTCTISSDYFSVEFARSGKSKWIKKAENDGLCQNDVVTTIEHEKDDTNKWTYTQIITNTDTDSKLCQAITLNVPYIFSYRPIRESLLNCDVIKFDYF